MTPGGDWHHWNMKFILFYITSINSHVDQCNTYGTRNLTQCQVPVGVVILYIYIIYIIMCVCVVIVGTTLVKPTLIKPVKSVGQCCYCE